MSHTNSTTNELFEARLAEIEPRLVRWARRAFYYADPLTFDDTLQEVRIALWKCFNADPEEWTTAPLASVMAYCKKVFRSRIAGDYRTGMRRIGVVASDMYCVTGDTDAPDDEALTLVHLAGRSQPNQFTRSREIHLADLRLDLEAAIQRGLDRLCPSQQHDMPLFISDLLAGYTQEEMRERHGWARAKTVRLMRKFRTVFYEELTGEKKNGFLGSLHPLTDAEKQRIRELYAGGLSYVKVAALVGRSPSAVEGVCKQYPPELVAQVRQLRAAGYSYQDIAHKVGRPKSYIGWLVQAALSGSDSQEQAIPCPDWPREREDHKQPIECQDWPRERNGQDFAPVVVGV